jgi:hypothetical protein
MSLVDCLLSRVSIELQGGGLRESSTVAATVSCLALLSLSAGNAHASECLVRSELIQTSQVAVQVWRGPQPVEGAIVSLIWQHGQGTPAATGETDSQGALQIDAVPPGYYSLRVTQADRSPVLIRNKYVISEEVNVWVVPSTEFPARLIAISLGGGMDCSTHCTVTGMVGPLAQAPKCLLPR